MAEKDSAKKEVKVTPEQLLNIYQNQRAQLDLLRQEQAYLQNILRDITSAVDALTELKKAGKKEQILVNLGGGAYIDAEVLSTSKVKANIGGGVIEKMSIVKVLEALRKRRQENVKRLETIAKDEALLIQNIETMEQTLARIQQQAKQKPEPSATPTVS